MNFYHITASEMAELSTLGGLSALFAGLSTFLVGVSWDISLTLSTSSMEATTESFLKGVQWPTGIGAMACIAIALGLFIRRIYRAGSIKNETKFP